MKQMLFVLAMALSIVAVSVPRQITAAELPPQIKIGRDILSLNGTGIRKKSLLSLYTAGLYLKEKSRQAGQIIAADETMTVRIEITSKFVSRSKMVSALKSGFESSTRGKTGPLGREIAQFEKCFSDDIEMGDVFDLVYVPGNGVIVLKNGDRKGTIKGIEFKQALFGIWLSNKPVDSGLKKGLLGG